MEFRRFPFDRQMLYIDVYGICNAEFTPSGTTARVAGGGPRDTAPGDDVSGWRVVGYPAIIAYHFSASDVLRQAEGMHPDDPAPFPVLGSNVASVEKPLGSASAGAKEFPGGEGARSAGPHGSAGAPSGSALAADLPGAGTAGRGAANQGAGPAGRGAAASQGASGPKSASGPGVGVAPSGVSYASSGSTVGNSVDNVTAPLLDNATGSLTLVNNSFVIQLVVDRNSSFYVFSIIVPMVLLVLMSCGVFLISPQDVATRVGTLLTLFLTLVALQFVANTGLPSSTYITSLQVFIIMSESFVALAGFESLFLYWLQRDDVKKRRQHASLRATVGAAQAGIRMQAAAARFAGTLSRPPAGTGTSVVTQHSNAPALDAWRCSQEGPSSDSSHPGNGPLGHDGEAVAGDHVADVNRGLHDGEMSGGGPMGSTASTASHEETLRGIACNEVALNGITVGHGGAGPHLSHLLADSSCGCGCSAGRSWLRQKIVHLAGATKRWWKDVRCGDEDALAKMDWVCFFAFPALYAVVFTIVFKS
eukprot:jgi/Mesvir1/18068/Mv09377-RA.2